MTARSISEAETHLAFERWPQMDREVTIGDVRLLCLPPGNVSISVHRAAHTINVSLNSNVVNMAFNSDELSKQDVVSGSIGYFPKGSTLILQCENLVPECLIEIGDKTMKSWGDTAGISELRPFDDTRPYRLDGAAANFARLAVHYLSSRDLGVAADSLMCEAIILGLCARYAAAAQASSANVSNGVIRNQEYKREVCLRRSMEYALAHLSDRSLTISDMAKVAGISSSYFSEVFREFWGYGPYSFIREKRLEYARDLIVHTVLPQSDIAFRCGFSSQAHMASSFKARFGVTPGSARK